METPNNRLTRFINRNLFAVLEQIALRQRRSMRSPANDKLISRIMSMLTVNKLESSYEGVLAWVRGNRSAIDKIWEDVLTKLYPDVSDASEGSMKLLTKRLQNVKLDDTEQRPRCSLAEPDGMETDPD